MKKRLIRMAEDTWTPDAVSTLTNNMAIGIKLINGGDAVEYAYSNDNGWDSPKEADIEEGERDSDEENQEVDLYFTTDEGTVYWIDDFIRTNM